MGTIVVTENATLDGVIEQVDDWFGPSDGDDDDADMLATTREQMEREAAVLLGRKTFEAFRGYWPAQTADTTGITAHLNRVPKYVLSRTLDDPAWAHTTVLRGDAVAEARALKARVDGEVGVTGSIQLVHALIEAGLVDEYRVFAYPRVLGRGRRLFESSRSGPKLELIDTRRFRSGVVLLTYRPLAERSS